jgi:asparagine synthase (glutamine-hydrolysing)
MAVLRGGTLLDGEGGDEVLGDGVHRIAPIERLARRKWFGWRPSGQAVAAAGRALLPPRLRVRSLARMWSLDRLTWLRSPARDALRTRLREVEAARPLRFDRSVARVPRQRMHVLAAQNVQVLAQPFDVEVSSPLLDDDVVAALARRGGRLGPGDRTAVLRWLVPDLLPDAVLSRTSKAWFNRCYFGAPTREFASRWDGSGIDERMVDAHALRQEWQSEWPHTMSAGLLQQAWLASDRPPD